MPYAKRRTKRVTNSRRASRGRVIHVRCLRRVMNKVIVVLLCLSAHVLPAYAQVASLRGQVTDESGGIVPGAAVTISGSGGFSVAATTAADGTYLFANLPLGAYTVQASSPGLALRRPGKVTLGPGGQIL